MDDHGVIRDGLRAILGRHPGIEVVGEAAGGREAITLAISLQPHVVVMDVGMPGVGGVEATGTLVARMPSIKVLALSVHSDRRYVLAMLRAGAAGYCLKERPAGELIAAIEQVARGGRYLDPSLADPMETSGVTPPAKELSPREREVLRLLAEGYTSRSVATSLQVSLATVETHRRQIMNKLGIHSIAKLTKYAIREGLTSVDE